jgi:hypothetical protein
MEVSRIGRSAWVTPGRSSSAVRPRSGAESQREPCSLSAAAIGQQGHAAGRARGWPHRQDHEQTHYCSQMRQYRCYQHGAGERIEPLTVRLQSLAAPQPSAARHLSRSHTGLEVASLGRTLAFSGGAATMRCHFVLIAAPVNGPLSGTGRAHGGAGFATARLICRPQRERAPPGSGSPTLTVQVQVADRWSGECA